MAELIERKVRKALAKDVGTGKIRLDPKDAETLEVKLGDIIEIEGKRKTVAKVHPLHPQDRGKEVIRIDGYTRENAGKISIGEKVKIRKTEPRVAERITLNPLTLTSWTPKEIIRMIEDRPLIKGDKLRATYGAVHHDFEVTNSLPEGPVMVDKSTKINFKRKKVGPEKVTYEDIGGLDGEIQKVREMIELPLKFPDVFERLGIEPPKGVLLHGPPGCGKTLIAKAIANESGCTFVEISGPEIVHKYVGSSSQHLRQVFTEAESNVPSILFIDEVDAISHKRETIAADQAAGIEHQNIVNQLSALLDGLKERKVIVIGATNIPDVIDPALRRPGRFDREIAIGVPNVKGRLEILEIHTRGMPLAQDVNLKQLAEITHGFVGADLASLSREAAMKCLRSIIPDIDFELEEIPYDKLMSLEVSWKHFVDVLNEIEPSALREVLIETPDVGWEDVGGLDEVKQTLIETIEWPLKYPKVFKHANTLPPKGILLHGSPGTGKTLVAKAVAKESGVNFISIKGPTLMSKWVGESEKGVREHFKKAKQGAPCILFFDEIDAIAPRRSDMDTTHVSERTISQILTELDGIEPLRGVVVLFATNRRDIIDPALLRAGRIDRELEFPLPDETTRKKIFEIHTRNKPLTKNINFKKLVDRTKGKTGADIMSWCKRAAMLAVREFMQKSSEEKRHNPDFYITREHFEQAFKEGDQTENSFSEKELREKLKNF